MTESKHNPYVGARTFEIGEGDFFYGREREALDLISLVISGRLVLFYAQSGAGKSSLINTKLIPGLLEEGEYKVLPVGRVGSGAALVSSDTKNVYAYNLITSLLQHNIKRNTIVNLKLSEFLTDYENNAENSELKRVLIIDQFEELFTTHQEAWEQRSDFFKQLAEALAKLPDLWVVLAMREDYIAYLDPYIHLLPGKLRVRYYMQRLSQEAAIAAVEGPAAKEGRAFARGIAKKVVDDLSSIMVRLPDDTLKPEPGQYVEPVQLQVFCNSLWEKLPAGRSEITEDDMQLVGDVSTSLGDYYARRVQAVVEGSVTQKHGVKERDVRLWFERKLILDGRIRNMVARETGAKTGSLNDEVIQEFVKRGDLVRAEQRGGALFYELTHDRLVEPIIENNRLWLDQNLKNLSLLQRQATLWDDDPNEKWLLRDQALTDVEEWAREHPEESNIATKFLEACRTQEAERKAKQEAERKELENANKLRDEQARSAQIARRFTLVAVFLMLIAVVASINAVGQKNKATASAETAVAASTLADHEKVAAEAAKSTAIASGATAQASEATAQASAKEALAGSLAAQAISLNNSDHALALLLGVEAYNRKPDDLLTKTTLFDLLQFTAYKKVADFNGTVNSAAVSPDGKWIAIASHNKDNPNLGEIRLFNQTLDKVDTIRGEYGIVYSLAFHQYNDRLVLAAGGCDSQGCNNVDEGQITLWEVNATGVFLLKQVSAHRSQVKTIAFSSDGKFLASGSYDKTIILWDLKILASPQPVGDPLHQASFVNEVTFSPHDKYVVSAGDDRAIYVWNVSQIENLKDNIPQPNIYNQELTAPVTSVAFSPDGKTLASAGYDSLIRLWDWNTGSLSLRSVKNTLVGHTGYVTSLTFNAAGLLASAGFDNQIIVWNIKTGKRIGPALNVHTKAINQVVFGSYSSKPYLISVGNDQTAIQWDLFTRNPLSPFPEYSAPENVSLRSNPSGWLAMACKAAQRNLTAAEWNKYLPGQAYEKKCG